MLSNVNRTTIVKTHQHQTHQHQNALYRQQHSMPGSGAADSAQPHGGGVDLRYIEVGEGLPVEEGPLSSLSSLGAIGLNLEVDSGELDQYLPEQVLHPMHQYPATSGQWLTSR